MKLDRKLYCCIDVGILYHNFSFISPQQEIVTVNDVEYDILPEKMVYYAHKNDIHTIEIYGAKVLTKEIKRRITELTAKEYSNDYSIKVELKERK